MSENFENYTLRHKSSEKTSAAYMLSLELGYELVEINASDVRTKDNL
jgi:hypothetical protein